MNALCLCGFDFPIDPFFQGLLAIGGIAVLIILAALRMKIRGE